MNGKLLRPRLILLALPPTVLLKPRLSPCKYTRLLLLRAVRLLGLPVVRLLGLPVVRRVVRPRPLRLVRLLAPRLVRLRARRPIRLRAPRTVRLLHRRKAQHLGPRIPRRELPRTIQPLPRLKALMTWMIVSSKKSIFVLPLTYPARFVRHPLVQPHVRLLAQIQIARTRATVVTP